MESPLARRVVSGFFCSTVAEGALRTWGIVGEEERGPADTVDAFKSGARMDGNKVLTGEGFPPADLLGKGDEVANLVDSSLTGKRAAIAISRKRRVDLHPRSGGFGVGLPALQTDLHRTAGRGRSRTPSLKAAMCRRTRLTTARRVAWGGRLMRGFPCQG